MRHHGQGVLIAIVLSMCGSMYAGEKNRDFVLGGSEDGHVILGDIGGDVIITRVYLPIL